MENLPVELLEIIFKQLSSLKDLQQCYKTCLRWRQIIAKLFDKKGKLNILISLIFTEYLAIGQD